MTSHRYIARRVARAIAAACHSAALAGFASLLFVLVALSPARADDAAGSGTASERIVVAQNASASPDRLARQGPGEAISREYLIKAAILFNFAKFATWPDDAFSDPAAPLRVCVLGDDPFGEALDSLNGKHVRNRSLVTTRIDDLDGAPACHIMFVSHSEAPRIAEILDHVGKMPILTVGDMGRFANIGGIIALKEVENRSRIEINVGAAKQAGLTLSSKLLRLADTVSTQAANHVVQ